MCHSKACVLMSVLLLSALAQGSLLYAQELVFKDKGTLIKQLSREQLEGIVLSKTVKVYEPHEMGDREYVGFAVKDLLTGIYGKGWQKAEEILFTCADGYQPSIPTWKFYQYSAYLIFKKAEGGDFTIQNKTQNNEVVLLGPFYLVWDNLQDSVLKVEGGSDWPYQVTTLDLIAFADRFPHMAPPISSPQNVKSGFVAFRKYCQPCHTINGEGGVKSVELNYPASVTEYYREAWLRRWIANPTSIRFNTTMPALNPAAPNRKAMIEDIVAYLKAMASNKRKPTAMEK